jgi:hypothetical protein
MTPYRDDQALAYRNAEIERRHTALLKSLDQRTARSAPPSPTR